MACETAFATVFILVLRPPVPDGSSTDHLPISGLSENECSLFMSKQVSAHLSGIYCPPSNFRLPGASSGGPWVHLSMPTVHTEEQTAALEHLPTSDNDRLTPPPAFRWRWTPPLCGRTHATVRSPLDGLSSHPLTVSTLFTVRTVASPRRP